MSRVTSQVRQSPSKTSEVVASGIDHPLDALSDSPSKLNLPRAHGYDSKLLDLNQRLAKYNQKIELSETQHLDENMLPTGRDSYLGLTSNIKPASTLNYTSKFRNNNMVELDNRLEDNRNTLSKMRAELKNKLQEVSAKTEEYSALRKEQTTSHNERVKEKHLDTSSYEEILSKYSKRSPYRAVAEAPTIKREEARFAQKEIQSGTVQQFHLRNNNSASKADKMFEQYCKSGFSQSQDKIRDSLTNHHLKSNTNQGTAELESRIAVTRTITEEHMMSVNKADILHTREKDLAQHESNNSHKTHLMRKKPAYQEAEPSEFSITRNPVEEYNSRSSHQPQGVSELGKFKEKYGLGRRNNLQSKSTDLKAGSISVSKERNKRSNAEISEEIEKLDARIRNIEQQKDINNIFFRPFQGAGQARTTTNQQKPSPAAIKQRSKERQLRDASFNRGYDAKYKGYLEKIKPMYSQFDKKDESKSYLTKDHPSKLEHSIQSNIQQRRKKSVDVGRTTTDFTLKFRKETTSPSKGSGSGLKELVRVLSAQVNLDEIFRNHKIWFSSEPEASKWQYLCRTLRQQGLSLTESEVKDKFSLRQSENNPFFSVTESQSNMAALVEAYLKCDEHWNRYLAGRFKRTELTGEGLQNKLDPNSSGRVEIEDVVRFLNLESGSFFRNRDVSLMFRRMAGEAQWALFEQIIGVLAH